MAPILLVVSSYFILDPFRVLYRYGRYYEGCFIEPNRDYVSTQVYLQNRPSRTYDSFIFGSSKSQAFCCGEWKKYHPEIDCFHYDAAAETLYGIERKLRFLDSSGARLDHVLIVLDQQTVSGVANSRGPLFIKHPRISGESRFQFQLVFFKAYFQESFFVKYLDFLLFRKLRPYMKDVIHDNGLALDPETNDAVHRILKVIVADPDKFYAGRKKMFYERSPEAYKKSRSVIGKEQIELLRNIEDVLQKHRTHVQIVVSPSYDQIPLHPDDRSALKSIFGDGNVFDFSGVNEFTSNARNYGDATHYLPRVANEIWRRIDRAEGVR